MTDGSDTRLMEKIELFEKKFNSAIERLFEEVRSFKQDILSEISALNNHVIHLQDRVEELETVSRRKHLLIHGVPEKSGEDVNKIITQIMIEKLKISDFTNKEISQCYRFGQRKAEATKPRPILVKFQNLYSRNNVWGKKRALKGQKVTISESLIPSRQKLLAEAREVFKINRCWTNNGSIIILMHDDSRRTVHNKSQLDQAIKDSSGHNIHNEAKQQTRETTRLNLRPRANKQGDTKQ